MERYVIMKFKTECVEEFLSIFEANKNKIAAFEGCTFLELRQSKSRPNWMMTFSLWDDEKFLNMYRNSALFKSVWDSVKPLFEADAEALSIWPEKKGEEKKREEFLAKFDS
jgi:(4S)-4-hydroxy-5-phosphonooxypentane-2,3-dione isomerase